MKITLLNTSNVDILAYEASQMGFWPMLIGQSLVVDGKSGQSITFYNATTFAVITTHTVPSGVSEAIYRGQGSGVTLNVTNWGVPTSQTTATLAALPFVPPSWAANPEALSFFCGFFLMALVRITRAGLRWVSRTGEDLPSS